MNSFKQSFMKDGKLNIGLIILKLVVVVMGIIYLVLLFKFKDISIGSFTFPPNNFGLFHWIMMLPAIASFAFAVLAMNDRWTTVMWQTLIIMISCLIIVAMVGVFTGMKSTTTDSNNYLALDSYFEDTDAPMVNEGSEIEQTVTFAETVKKLMPESIPNEAKSVDYYYYYTGLPLLGSYFDVYASWELPAAALSGESSRLSKLYPGATKYTDENDTDTQYYLIRSDDNDGEYYYVFYGINNKKSEITYCVSYSERSSATPYFEEIGIDLGRVGKVEEESSAGEAVSEQE